MNDFDNQEANGATPPGELEEFAVEISDLSPDTRGHYALLRLRAIKDNLRPGARKPLALSKQTAREARRADDDFEIEFSDLPPSERSHYFLLRLVALKERVRAALPGLMPARTRAGAARPTRRQRRASVGRVLTALGLCAAVLLLLAGNVPSLRSRLIGLFEPPIPTQAPLIADTSNLFPSSNGVDIHVRRSNLAPIQASGSLGPLPATCPRANTLQSFESPLDPPGLGSGPVWLVGFSGPTASLVHLNSSQAKWLGWYQTLTLFVEKGYEGTLLLQGGSQANGAPLWFSDESMSNTNNSLYFDMQRTTDKQRFYSSGQWEFVPVDVFIPASGCYFLQANWSGGSWIADFAAGSL
jgi:hypothetical protein